MTYFNSYTGNTTINGNGTLILSYANPNAAVVPTSIISSSTEVVLGGGTLNVTGQVATGSNSQTVAALAVKVRRLGRHYDPELWSRCHKQYHAERE